MKIAEYSLSNLVDPVVPRRPLRPRTARRVELGHSSGRFGSWSYLVPLDRCSLSPAALVLRRFRPALFGLGWLAALVRGPRRDLLDLDQPAREPPRQLVRPHDRQPRARRAGCSCRCCSTTTALRTARAGRSSRGASRRRRTPSRRAPRRGSVSSPGRERMNEPTSTATSSPSTRQNPDPRTTTETSSWPLSRSSCSCPGVSGGSSKKLIPNASTPRTRRTKRTFPPGPALSSSATLITEYPIVGGHCTRILLR